MCVCVEPSTGALNYELFRYYILLIISHGLLFTLYTIIILTCLLLPFVTQVSRLTQVAERLSTCPQLAIRLSSLSSTLATKVPPRVLMPNVARCYNSMVDSQQVWVIILCL